MLTEYFYPHDRGGSAWSTFFLSQQLVKGGHRISVLTPNYGSIRVQTWKGLKIHRFKIGKKLKKSDAAISPFWHSNLAWVIISTFNTLRLTGKQSIGIIHVQSKSFLPSAWLVSKIRKIPFVFTARDYQVICNLGFCLWEDHKRCSWTEYVKKDIRQYNDEYLNNPSYLKKGIFFLFHLRARIITNYLGWFAKRADKLVCISLAQRKKFIANGFLNTTTIYNSVKFVPAQVKKNMHLVYLGRLTPGKGVDLLIPIFQATRRYNQNLKLIIMGEGILKEEILKQIKQARLGRRVNLTGHLPYNKAIKILSKARLGIFPSRWPEPFGRGALEAISLGVPVVTSDRGGLPEIVQNKYGLSVKTEIKSLSSAVNQVLKNSDKFSLVIKKNRLKLKQRFLHLPTQKYLSLYRKLTYQT